MSSFVEQSIAKAGLLQVLTAHRAGDLVALERARATWSAADLLLLGAIADIVRAEDSGDTVSIHEQHGGAHGEDVTWVAPVKGASELDILRAVATARIAGTKAARIGVDWSQCGMELAQVALGFGSAVDEGLAAMADLHHRGAFALPLEHFVLDTGKDRGRQCGWAGAEIEGTRH